MAALHVRDLDDAVIDALKKRAAAKHRSLQGEVKTILEKAAFGSQTRRSKPAALRLKKVRVGSSSRYSRDDIYEDDAR
jgi:plasmid stability protein